jgi:hypothetical protein
MEYVARRNVTNGSVSASCVFYAVHADTYVTQQLE